MRSALHKKFLPPFKGGSLDPLMIGLESYWALDELSGTRFDSIGSNDLTDNNTVTYVNDGPRGVNASFVRANTEYLEGGKTSLTGDVSISGWVKFSDLAVYQLVFGNTDGSTRQVELSSSGAINGLLACVHTDGVSVEFNAADPKSRMNDSKWHNVLMTYSHTGDKKIRVYIDTELIDTSTATTGNLINSMNVSRIGSWPFGSTEGNTSRVGVWTKVLSAPEILELYNSGRGKSYADLSSGIKTNLVSYWNLDEVSIGAGAVTRNDSHGTNHLTDNNTVGSVNTGPEAVVANFVVANLETLTHAALNAFGGGYTISLWVKSKVTGGTYYFFSAANGPYIYWSNASGGFAATHGTGNPIIASAPIFTEWNHIILKSSGGNMTLRINDSVEASAAHNTPAETEFMLGGVSGTASLDGYMSEVGIWSSALSAAEITELFNAGVGKKYSELSAGIKTNLVSYWNLTELSGNRADSHGANTLTDNNTVMSVINMPDVANNVSAKFVAANSEYLSRNAIVIADGTDITMVAWIKLADDDGASQYYIFDSGDGGSYGHGLFWFATDNKLYGAIGGASPGIDIGSPVGTWIFVVYEYTFTTDLVRIMARGSDTNSGVWSATVSAAALNHNAGFYIGRSSPFAARLMNGQIDEVMFYTRKLTALEIDRLFNLGKGVFYPTFT